MITCDRSRLLRSYSLLASTCLALAGNAAFAQTTTDAPADASIAAPAASGDIIVTGQRRSETLTKAAVAVSVFDAGAIKAAGITNPGDFLKMTPNVTYVASNQPGELFVAIRGNTAVRTGESSVALVIDGVQQIDANSVSQELFDLKQIEILKGPQGALYGRNAIGGAIVLTTKQPSFTDVEGSMKVAVANGGEHRGQAVLSVPLSDTLAARGGIDFIDRRGYYKNHVTGENVDRYRNLTGVVRLLWKPSPDFEADLNARVSKVDGGGIYWNAALVGVTSTDISANNTSIPWTANIPGYTDNKRQNVSLKLTYTLPFATLTSTTAYAYLVDSVGADSYPYTYDPGQFTTLFPGSSAIGLGAQTQNIGRTAKDWYTELRLASPVAQPFRWSVGATFVKFKIRNFSTTGADTDGVNLGYGPYPYGSLNQTLGFNDDRNDNRAYAFFANLDYDVTPELMLSASLRYDNERKEQTNYAQAGAADPADPKAIPTYYSAPGLSRKATFDAWQPKFTARYATGGFSVYASYGRGFKSGGFNPFGTRANLLKFNPATTIQDIYGEETANTAELGVKMKMLGGKVRAEAAIFQTDTKNAQLQEFIPQLSLQAISAADKLRTRGIEGSIAARIAHGFQINLGAGYIDPKVTEFGSNPAYVGNQRPSTSKVTFNAGAQYEAELSDTTSLTARADYAYQSRTYWDWANTPGSSRSGFGLVNGRLTVTHGDLDVSLYGKNILNKHYNQDSIVLLPVAAALWRAAPRSYGLEAAYHF